ncbi:hypothetical protein [Streptomyces coelicoflavus]|uniref:hypothetical protein n=1 Tax=Streptomyces coelicoflavus TaxID=285562 RepID=UPI002E266117
MSAGEPGGSDGSTGSASGSGWFGSSGESPRAHRGPDADRTEILGGRIGGQGRRVPGQDPSAQGRITWGTTDPAGAHPGSAAPGNARNEATPNATPNAAANNAAPTPDLFGKAPYAAPTPGTGHARGTGHRDTGHARDTGQARGTGHGPDPDRTDVLQPAGPTRAFPAPAPAPAPAPQPGPATAALRDPWQELPDTDGDAGTGAGDAGHTHDPHEVTVQLDAVHLGDGMVLRADGGHRKSRPEPSEGPVFVDASGRRSRLYRRIGILVGIACAVYAVVIVSTLLSGNSDAPWMPVPGQEEGAPAGQVDTTPLPSQPAQPSGTGAAVPQTSPSADAGAATAPGAEAPVPGTSGAPGVTGGIAGQPGTSPGPRSSASGTGRNPGGSGATGPDPAQSTQASPPAATEPSTPAGGGDTTADPTESTGGSTTGTDPGEGGANANGAGDPDPVAGPAGAPVVAAGPAGTSTSSSFDSVDSSDSSDSLSPENTL